MAGKWKDPQKCFPLPIMCHATKDIQLKNNVMFYCIMLYTYSLCKIRFLKFFFIFFFYAKIRKGNNVVMDRHTGRQTK